jgi:hypothetical protein
VRWCLLVALQFVDERAGLSDAKFVCGGEPVAIPKQVHEIDTAASTDSPDRFDL